MGSNYIYFIFMLPSENSFTISSNFDNSNSNKFTNPSTPLDVSLPLGKSSASLREEPLALPVGANPSPNPNPLFSKSWWINPDLNGNGKTDIFWHNTQTGDNNWWLIDGSLVVDANVGNKFSTDDNWKYQVGDIDGDGNSDLAWRNFKTGQNSVWLMQGNNELKDAYFIPEMKTDVPNWDFKLGDTNGDGKSDLIWRNYKTGQNSVWQMNGKDIGKSAFLTTVPDVKWDFEVADSNGDGRSDLIWRNSRTGENSSWILNSDGLSLNLENAKFLPKVEDLNWKFKIADTDGNGKTDLVWHNYKTGENSVWFLKDNGLDFDYGAFLGEKITDLNWDFSIADTNGDGKTDLVWRNYKTGENSIWKISASRVSGSDLGVGKIDGAEFLLKREDLNWDFNIGDYNGDGKSDLLWRNFQTGENQLWFLDDLKVQVNGVADIVPLPKGWVFL
jgi:FG-GAP-like repeat